MKRMILCTLMLILGLSVIAWAAATVEIKGNGNVIVENAPASTTINTQWGSIAVGTTTPHSFTLKNLGPDSIAIGSQWAPGAPPQSDWWKLTAPALGAKIAPNATVTMTIELKTIGGYGTYGPVLFGFDIWCIKNGVQGNPFSRQFYVDAYGIEPEIDVKGKAWTPIVNNDLAPSLVDGTILPDAIVFGPATWQVFTIYNKGVNHPGQPILSDLTISASLAGTNPGDFTVALNKTTVPVGDSAKLTVQFVPTTGGLRKATVNIANNDANENPYVFAVEGNGYDVSSVCIYVIDDDNANGVWDLNEVGVQAAEVWVNGKTYEGCDGTKLTGQRGGTSFQHLRWQSYEVGLNLLTIPAGYVLTNGSAKRTAKADTYDGEALVVFLISKNAPGGGTTQGDQAAPGAIPMEYGMSQNYPNPFNPTTAINVALVEDTHVTLQIYDVTGRVVATLVDGLKSAGHHVVEFNATNLPSGYYFYKIHAGNYSATKSMVLLK
jgi:hypothetical protein